MARTWQQFKITQRALPVITQADYKIEFLTGWSPTTVFGMISHCFDAKGILGCYSSLLFLNSIMPWLPVAAEQQGAHEK